MKRRVEEEKKSIEHLRNVRTSMKKHEMFKLFASLMIKKNIAEHVQRLFYEFKMLNIDSKQ